MGAEAGGCPGAAVSCGCGGFNALLQLQQRVWPAHPASIKKRRASARWAEHQQGLDLNALREPPHPHRRAGPEESLAGPPRFKKSQAKPRQAEPSRVVDVAGSGRSGWNSLPLRWRLQWWWELKPLVLLAGPCLLCGLVRRAAT